jgi:hypothetical protein
MIKHIVMLSRKDGTAPTVWATPGGRREESQEAARRRSGLRDPAPYG